MKWQIEVYDATTKTWRAFGEPSSSFEFAYAGAGKLQEAGHKVRVRKVETK